MTLFLATDFGLEDEFVGILHAVARRYAPDVAIVDLTHGIAPFDVVGGAALLERSVEHLGSGVLCAVVDPGVGTARRAVAIELDAPLRHLVGPDNGLLAPALARLGGAVRAVELDVERVTGGSAPANTFDGRDLFVPAAARLARGDAITELGEPVDPASLVLPEPARVHRATLADGRTQLRCEVAWVDRYGNIQLALDADVLEGVATAAIEVGDEDLIVPIVQGFADAPGSGVALLGDANARVAIVMDRASAAARLGVTVGDVVGLVGFFGPGT